MQYQPKDRQMQEYDTPRSDEPYQKPIRTVGDGRRPKKNKAMHEKDQRNNFDADDDVEISANPNHAARDGQKGGRGGYGRGGKKDQKDQYQHKQNRRQQIWSKNK